MTEPIGPRPPSEQDSAPQTRRYLADLNRALRDLPRARRRDIVADVRSHIDSALSSATSDRPVDIETVLAHLGPPSEIAAAAREQLGQVSGSGRIAGRDIAAIVLVLLGGLVVPVVGWFVGVVLLWASTAWRLRDKIIATALVPGGLLLPVVSAGLMLSFASYTAGGSSALETSIVAVLRVLSVVGPLFSTYWLVRHARRL